MWPAYMHAVLLQPIYKIQLLNECIIGRYVHKNVMHCKHTFTIEKHHNIGIVQTDIFSLVSRNS